MPNRDVLQHQCTAPKFDDGSAFDCRCTHRVARKEAKRLIARGLAVWKQQRNPNGKTFNDTSAIVLDNAKRWPRARLITDRDVKRAYVDGGDEGVAEQKRILMFGAAGDAVRKLANPKEKRNS